MYTKSTFLVVYILFYNMKQCYMYKLLILYCNGKPKFHIHMNKENICQTAAYAK